jgi:hypothetical protein
MIEITIATMGRFTKKRAMVYFASPAVGAAPVSFAAAGAGLAATVIPSWIR